MIGVLRLALACCVALSHAEVPVFGYHLGVPAVVVFYMLAGYVVTLQWRQMGDREPYSRRLSRFLADRALRLLPTYFLALAAATAVIVLFRNSEAVFFPQFPIEGCWASNLFIVPLNYFPFTGVDQCMVIPVAWSLGLEIQFYLIFPFLMVSSRSLPWIGLASALVFCVALSGTINTDIWGYRLLPGTLFIFLLGTLLASEEKFSTFSGRLCLGVSSALAGLTAILLYLSSQNYVHFSVETTVGLGLSIPLILLAKQIGRSWWDNMAGISAYPLFLLHFPCLWLFKIYAPALLLTTMGLVIYLFTSVCVAMLVGLMVDRPLGRLRREIRASKKSADRLSSLRP